MVEDRRSKRSYSELGLKFEDEQEDNRSPLKRTYSTLKGSEFEQFAFALIKLAEIDNLDIVCQR